jgi:hypothetical protein
MRPILLRKKGCASNYKDPDKRGEVILERLILDGTQHKKNYKEVLK